MSLHPTPPPPAGFADVEGSRVRFTPPAEAAILRTDKKWRTEPLPHGNTCLRDEAGNSFGQFASADVAERTAERLSR